MLYGYACQYRTAFRPGADDAKLSPSADPTLIRNRTPATQIAGVFSCVSILLIQPLLLKALVVFLQLFKGYRTKGVNIRAGIQQSLPDSNQGKEI